MSKAVQTERIGHLAGYSHVLLLDFIWGDITNGGNYDQ